MTNKEKAVKFFKDYVEEKGYKPTFQEIGDHLGITRQGALGHFRRNPAAYIEIFPPMIKHLK